MREPIPEALHIKGRPYGKSRQGSYAHTINKPKFTLIYPYLSHFDTTRAFVV